MRAKGKRNFLVKIKSRKTNKIKKYKINNKLTFAEAVIEVYKIHNSLFYGIENDNGPWHIISVIEKE